jgi:ParB-like chromosome segregation protein Spo0J
MKIKLMDVVIDPSIMVREVNTFIVGNYAESMRAGAEFPPIVVDSKNRLVCGHTRYAAYKKVFGPDYSLTATVTKNTKDVDLIMEAAGDNSKHGHPLDTYEKKKVVLRLKEHGVDPAKISKILGVTVDRVEEWAEMTVVVIGQDRQRRVEPLKSGFRHMAGRTVKEVDYQKHETKDMGVTMIFHAHKLTDVLTRDGWTSTDEKTIEALTVLQEAITAFLRKTKKSRAV